MEKVIDRTRMINLLKKIGDKCLDWRDNLDASGDKEGANALHSDFNEIWRLINLLEKGKELSESDWESFNKAIEMWEHIYGTHISRDGIERNS